MITTALIRAWLVILSVLTIWSYWMIPNGDVTDALRSSAYVLAPATAMLCAWWAAKQFGWRNIQGKALVLISGGLTAWFIGEVLWVYYDYVTKTDAYPSAADYFYLVAYVAFGIGLVMQFKFLHSARLNATQRLLLGIIAGLLTFVAFYFGVYLAIKPEFSLLENAIAISYGLADVLLVLMGLALVVVSMELRGGKFARAWGWFLIGLACIFVADLGFAWFTPEYEANVGWYKSVLDSLWIFAYILMAHGLGQLASMIVAVQTALRNVK